MGITKNAGKRDSGISIKGIRIAKEILTKRFSPCDLQACRHACCREGAIIGTPGIRRIQKLLPELFPLMRPEAVETVRKKGFCLDTDYTRSDMDKSHKHHNFRTVKGRCVFLNYFDNGGCVLQKYCAVHNINDHLKPGGCWSFPIDIIGNMLVVYQWKTLPCLKDSRNKKSPPIYLSCKTELTDFLGEDGYRELLLKIKKLPEYAG